MSTQPRHQNGTFAEMAHSDSEVTLDASPAVPEMSLEILASRVPEALHKVNVANRKLERAGVKERFTPEVSEPFYVDESDGSTTKRVTFTLNRPRISAGGWTFTGAHATTADGRILNYGAAVADEMRCDHCGHNRRRGKVYTVTHAETGETKIVGSNCLTAFLGVSPSGLWALTEEPVDSEGGWVSSPSPDDIAYAADDVLLDALAVSDEGRTFVPRSKATRENPATADVMLKRVIQHDAHPRERVELANEIRAWLASVPAGESDYTDNLKVLLEGDERMVSRKHVAFAASAVSAFRRSQEVKVTSERPAPTPGFIAPVGERIRDVPVTVLFTRYLGHDDYGNERSLLVGRDESGHQVKWWAPRDVDVEDGTVLTMTATVKGHGTYDDADETTVFRAVVTNENGEKL